MPKKYCNLCCEAVHCLAQQKEDFHEIEDDVEELEEPSDSDEEEQENSGPKKEANKMHSLLRTPVLNIKV